MTKGRLQFAITIQLGVKLQKRDRGPRWPPYEGRSFSLSSPRASCDYFWVREAENGRGRRRAGPLPDPGSRVRVQVSKEGTHLDAQDATTDLCVDLGDELLENTWTTDYGGMRDFGCELWPLQCQIDKIKRLRRNVR